MKKKLLKLFLFIFGMTLIGGLAGIAVLAYFSLSLPKISTLADYRPPLPSQILAKDGTVLALIGKEKRMIADFDEIPKILVDAFLSAEDDGFYDHQGVDYLGVLRALMVNIRAGRVVQGGSTITQQVAKSLLLTRERSLTRKIKDFLLAQKIEKKFSKKEILYLYLNQVYLGGGYYGVKAALKGYFGKGIAQASVAEAAMIAGLLVAPGKYSPYVSPKRAKMRQSYVLKRLYETGKITQEKYEQAKKESIKYMLKRNGQFKAGYFTEWVRQRATKLLGKDEFLVGGYTINTTIDLKLQEVAEKAVYEGAEEIDKRQGYQGPIATIDLSQRDEVAKFEMNYREEVFKQNSHYFTIDEAFNKIYERHEEEMSYENIVDRRNGWPRALAKLKILPGNILNDPLLTNLKQGKLYRGIVLEVDDKKKVAFVSVGGISGMIPYDDFKWAHKRNILKNRSNVPMITRPSQVFKRGDIILVKILANEVTYHQLLKIRPNSLRLSRARKNLVAKQRYLHCKLEQIPIVQGALLSMEPMTGEILALVGGTNFKKSKYNRAIQSKRQPGSSFKPVLFAAGLERGLYPNSIIIDSPEALGGGREQVSWKPKNYDGKFKGPMTFRNSLEQSRNIPTIKIANKVGINYILKFSKRIGFKAKMAEDLSLALGSFGSTLLDMASTYALFPNGGKRVEAKSVINVIDRDGNVFLIKENDSHLEKVTLQSEDKQAEELKERPFAKEEQSPLDGKKKGQGSYKESIISKMFQENLNDKQVYDKRLAYIMSNLLKGVVLHGTGRSARSVGHFIGGKTGTTSDYIDAWFLGFSSNVVTGVWTGFDNNTTMGFGETGTKAALPIWKKLMAAALKTYGEKDFQVPKGIINVLINKKTGKLITDNNTNAFREAFVVGTAPNEAGSNLLEEGEQEKNGLNMIGDDEYYDSQ